VPGRIAAPAALLNWIVPGFTVVVTAGPVGGPKNGMLLPVAMVAPFGSIVPPPPTVNLDVKVLLLMVPPVPVKLPSTNNSLAATS
jgi:hypothetical protein